MIVIQLHPDFIEEKKYVWNYLLGELLQLQVRFEANEGQSGYLLTANNRQLWFADDFFHRSQRIDHLYSLENLPKLPVRLNHPLAPEGDLVTLYGAPEINSSDQHFECHLDITASTFFMLTRWEETVVETRDRFGRFPFSASVNCRFELQYRPLVNEYAFFLAQVLRSLGYPVDLPAREVRFLPSHDIDYISLWPTWYHRLRTIGGDILVRRDLTFTRWMWKEFGKLMSNPYHTLERLIGKAAVRNVTATFYIRSDEVDYSLLDPHLGQWINRIAKSGHRLGFHPGIAAAGNEEIFLNEYEKLKAILPVSADTGRTHYLNFTVPDTWRYWHDACIKEDSSMAYSEEPGFRCSCCTAFPVFDFKQGIEIPVRELPLLWMDRHLTKKNLTTETATRLVQSIWETTCKYQGDYVFLWHNSSFYLPEWKPYDAVFEAVYSF
ncbi:MAG: hypothetical protein KDC59_21845 [Saprospiraceae bacterium]|nr:hypothetical protein [Saprospiraceae bacterium]